MNPFYISSIILATVGFMLGFLVYLKNTKSNLNRWWFVLSIFIAGWSISLYFVASAKNISTALWWQYVLDIIAIWIPFVYFGFIEAFLKINQRIQLWLIGLTAVALSLFSFTNFFKIGIVQKFNFFWIDPGFLYPIFPLFFVGIITYSLMLLIRAYKKEPEGSMLQSQIRYQIIAGAIGFSGGTTNFLPQLFNVFPFGNYFVLFYIFFVSYSILKHHLFNLKLILVEISLTLLNLSLFINVFLSNGTPNFILNGVIFFGILIFSILLLRSIYKDIRDREYIETLAKDMENANKRLIAMEQSKTEFVSIASHQLRTPLTVIKGYASMILEGTFGKLSEQAQIAMNNLYQSSEKVVALVEDLLTVSRIEQGRMMLVLKPMNFIEFVQTTITEMEGKIKALGLDLVFTIEEEKGFLVSIDEKKMKQVIVHLLDNAIKYTKAPGTITVALSLDDATRKVYMAISDTGAGMTPRQIRAISDRFGLHIEDEEKGKKLSIEELDTTEAPKDASLESDDAGIRNGGIGLYISQEIAQAHHGTLRIESSGLGKGTTITVELPQAEK